MTDEKAAPKSKESETKKAPGKEAPVKAAAPQEDVKEAIVEGVKEGVKEAVKSISKPDSKSSLAKSISQDSPMKGIQLITEDNTNQDKTPENPYGFKFKLAKPFFNLAVPGGRQLARGYLTQFEHDCIHQLKGGAEYLDKIIVGKFDAKQWAKELAQRKEDNAKRAGKK